MTLRSAGERGGSGLQVHLGLAAPGRAVQQHVATVRIERGDDPLDARDLLGSQLGGLGLAAERIAGTGLAARPPSPRHERCNECQRTGRSRAVVVGHPERELDERRGNVVDDRPRVRDLDSVGSGGVHVDDDSAHLPPAEADGHDIAASDLVSHAVREDARKRTRRDEREDLGEGHAASVSAAPAPAASRFRDAWRRCKVRLTWTAR